MTVTFIAPAVLVKSIEESRKFYEGVLGQKIEMDNGEHVSFQGGFSIWQGKHAFGVIYGGDASFSRSPGEKTFELYFETDRLDETEIELKNLKVDFIHGIHEHPWGQRGFRILDPDGNIVEVSEPLSVVVHRFHENGMGEEAISQSTSIPVEIVKEMLKK